MFESLNHDFIVAVASCIKRKLGIALFAIICIILLFSNAAHAASAQGQVFEDVNYGGGPGRTQAASSGVGIANVRVELYNSSGFYVTDTTTNASGAYTFSSISSGTYYVRVVNSTVRSSRAGSTGAEVGVQTYRREGTDITNEVGGRHPAQVDVAANTSSQSLNTSTWRLSGGGYVQSVTTVTVPSAGSVSNVNFGFNFSTIVNTNDAGQGSLRQFILNANLLANTGLNQTTFNSISKDAGWNHSIFNIPNVAGLRTADSSTLSGGTGTAYLIRPTTSLPPITRSNVAIDGRTQTAFSGDTNSAVADVSTGPEIIIDHQGSVQNGVLQSNNALVQIWNVGVVNTGDTSSTSGGINIVGASASGSRIENVTAARNADSGINVGVLSPHVTGPAANNVIIRGSIIRNNGRVNAASDGIGIYNSSSGTLIVNNSINNNASYGIDIQSGTVTGTTIQNNRIYSNGATSTANQRAGIGVRVGNTMTIRDNEIFSNSGDGIVVLNGSRFIDITQNEIYRNGELGIDLSANTAAAGDGMTPNGNPPTATGGNDLLNFPQLIYSQVNGTTLYVEGCAPSGARIEIFEADITGGGAALNDNKQPSSLSKDYGEGFAYLGTFTHTSGELCTITSPDADGNAATSMTWFRQVITTPYNLPVGRYVTATAHYDDRGTSEFSGIQQVNAATVHNCPVGTTATGSGFATAGSGLYKDQLYWLDWSCGAVSQYNPGDTINKQ